MTDTLRDELIRLGHEDDGAYYVEVGEALGQVSAWLRSEAADLRRQAELHPPRPYVPDRLKHEASVLESCADKITEGAAGG